ncbi:fluoride efflux transporter CrcB [Paenarthrobacter sp. Z7-10]|uniref:fluoride efflux transporter CrcB n=1 Tax=Paenarthrobacter sp. Z7-10 TaxID=2787635 RepID=UPI0022A91B90|nr:fluoride efflux transporter CrcB [Paenarthrobacter sp. Z7-10]MCZ2403584.1 fluoride efflux transporter CrcB [Paenarthrobacter sp. Z7-10]
MTVLLLGLAGGLGAGLRFAVDSLLRARIRTAVPLGTMLINISGSLLLGFLAGLLSHRASPGDLQLILGTGFLGGYTTFSTASFETIRLIQSRRSGLALLNGLGTLAGCVLAAAVGVALASVV